MTDALGMKKLSVAIAFGFLTLSFGQPASSLSPGAVIEPIADPDTSAQRAAAPKAIAVS